MMSRKADDLEGVHYSILEKWAANGKVDSLPEEMEEYLKHLTAVLGFHTRSFGKTQIIKRLRLTFNLNYSQAKSRYIDSLNYFYLDQDVKFEARMRILAEKQEKIGDLIIQTSTSPEEAVLAVKPYAEAVKILEKIKPKESVPEDFYKKPFKVYTQDIKDLGISEPVNRNLLGKMVDAMLLDESQKIKIKQDLGTEPKQIFQFNEQENQDK